MKSPLESSSGGVLRILGSVRFTLFLLTAGVAALAVEGTIESRFGFDSARTAIYGTQWFGFYFALVAVNLIAAVFKRIPIKRHDWPLVLTHFAIVLLLAGAAISRAYGFEGHVVLTEGEIAHSILLDSSEITLQGESGTDSIERRFLVPERGFQPGELSSGKDSQGLCVEVLEYIPSAVAHIELEQANEGSPGIELQLLSANGRIETWLLLGDDFSESRDVGPVELEMIELRGVAHPQQRFAAQEAEFPGGGIQKPMISILWGLENEVFLQATTAQGRGQAMPIRVGQILRLGELSLSIALTKSLAKARPKTSVETAKPDREDAAPAIRLLLSRGTDRDEFWLPRGGYQRTVLGGETYRLSFLRAHRDLPFAIKLDSLELEYRSGSEHPAAYVSYVTLIDLTGKVADVPTVISAHQPLDYLYYRLFQSSLWLSEGASPNTTILGVSFDPGVSIFYTGFVLLVLGVGWYLFGDSHHQRLLRDSLIPRGTTSPAARRLATIPSTTGTGKTKRPVGAPRARVGETESA